MPNVSIGSMAHCDACKNSTYFCLVFIPFCCEHPLAGDID